MKKSLKVLVSIVCVFAIFISSSAPALAATIYSSPGISVNVNDSHLIKMMEGMGLTDEEISYLKELEYERRENENPFPNSLLRAIPKNPYIGQKHTETYSLHWSTITMTTAGIAGALVKSGVALAIAMVVAGAIVNEVQERADTKGFKVSIQYVYGETNDGLLGWNMGYQSWSYLY